MKNTEFVVGDRVKVKAGKEHDDMVMNMSGSIVEISTPALAIKFDDMDEVHKWYVQAELEKSDDVAMVEKSSKKKPIVKSLDMEKRRATFVVLEPQPEDGTTTDLHGDWYSEEDIAEGCYSFNKHCRKANLLHLIDTNGFQFIESYILPSDAVIGETKVKKGSWVATIEVEDQEQHDWIWEGIKDGTFNGLSIQCEAYEQPMEK